jgi:Rrf2 family protein
MLLTKKSEYALLTLVIIAKNDQQYSTDHLATQLHISKSFLAKVLQNLARHNILTSHKGNNGGFSLKKSANELTILEIVTICEEKIPAVFECSTGGQMCSASANGGCTLFPILNNLQFKINNFLQNLTLQDIM